MRTSAIANELESAWRWREQRGVLSRLNAVRVFHGPGEGSGDLSRIAIDRFGEHFWITEWASEEKNGSSGGSLSDLLPEIATFLRVRTQGSAVVLLRPEKGVPEEPKVLFGEAPRERFVVEEDGLRFRIQLMGARHPGLFLDHFPLRQWLRERAKGLRVLNTFSYTGSLSVAAGVGGAEQVTTLDLSNPILQWAQENWELNGLSKEKARFIFGDYFEWLPRLKREGARFDCIILDPPSFSRGKKGTFSTSKDLLKLHSLAIDLLEPRGYLISSINSANVAREKFETEVRQASREKGVEFQVLRQIDLPETFPTRLGYPQQRYLKGMILQAKGR